MRILYLCLLLCLSLPGRAQRECCVPQFALSAYTGIVPEDCTGNYCTERDERIANFLSAVNAKKPQLARTEFLKLDIPQKNLSDQELRLVIHYANFLVARGNIHLSDAFYRFAQVNDLDDRYSLFIKASRVNGFSRSGDDAIILEMKRQIDTGELEYDILADIATNIFWKVDPPQRQLLRSDFHRLSEKATNPYVKYILLSSIYFEIQFSSPNYDQVIQNLEDYFSSIPDRQIGYKLDNFRVEVLIKEKRYEDALELIGSYMEKYIGTVDINQVLEIIQDSGASTLEEEVTMSYARAKLFQTRVGAPIKGVEESFELFFANEQRELEKSLSVIGTRFRPNGGYEQNTIQNILIIGKYLNDTLLGTDYLERSVFLLDATDSNNLYKLLQRNSETSKNTVFAEELYRIENLHKQIRELDVSVISFNEMFALSDEIERAEANFRTKYADYFAGLKNSWGTTFKSLQSDAAADTSATLAFYLAQGSSLYRLYLDADTTRVDILNYYRPRVESLAETLKDQLSARAATADVDATATELYENLFVGLDPATLPPRLNIIATESLEDLPFAILRRPARDSLPAAYLGQEHALSRQFSLKIMQMLRELEHPEGNGKTLGLAPVFRAQWAGYDRLRRSGYKLTPLVHTEAELRNLEALQPGKYLYGEDATLAAYYAESPDYSTLHLATHAISDPFDGLDSKVYLMDGAGGVTHVTARDIYRQRLNADLVTLSACESAWGGQDQVQGIVGLTRAYLAAGARTVVSTQGEVDDYAASQVMKHFYASIAGGTTPDYALRDAMRSYYADNPDAHPAEWGTFAAYGAMVPPAVTAQSDFPYLYLAVAAGVIVLVLLFLIRRRNR